ncbi:MAG: hypothetical protein AADX96_21290 [Thiocapsa sp. C3-sup]
MSAERIEAMVRKWCARLPHPFTPEDRAAGFRYELSILQAEFARTQVIDRPLAGCQLREELIRENLINNTGVVGIGRKLCNLPALRAIGYAANRRLLKVEAISQYCTLAAGLFEAVTQPQTIDGQRVPRLTFGDPRVMSLLATLCLFFIPQRFRNVWLREKMAQLLGVPLEDCGPGKAT